MNRKGIRRIANGYHYFFVKPNGSGSVHETAERLMEIDSVKEVAITEGPFGFVVKADDDGKAVLDRINKTVKGTSNVGACLCQYVK